MKTSIKFVTATSVVSFFKKIISFVLILNLLLSPLTIFAEEKPVLVDETAQAPASIKIDSETSGSVLPILELTPPKSEIENNSLQNDVKM